MKLAKITHPFTYYSDAKFSLFGDGVVKGLTNNELFPKASGEPLAAFQVALKAFQDSIPAPSDRSPALAAVKKEKKTVAIQECILLAAFVTYEARFNVAALETTNFELADKPKSKGLVGLVHDVVINTNGVNGMIIVSCKKDDNATIYNARVSTDQENWLWVKASTSRKVKLTNLPIGEKLYVQMQLENSHGYSPWSQSKVGIILESEAIMSIHG